MHFGEWIRLKRGDISQEVCAGRLGISQAAWAKYELSDGQPKRSTVERVAYALNISKEEDLEAAGYASAPGEVPAEVVTLWQRARRAGKETEMLRAWRANVDLVAPV